MKLLRTSPWLLALAGLLPAQGQFVNYEDPQVKPIAVATVGSFDYVLACNTPDNSVEVYKAEWNLQAPIARVPVGLSPVTVKWNAGTGHFFSCNYLGDSVSRVRLDLVPATPTTPETVHPVLEQTENVGNEPSDIAFDPTGGTAVVTLHAQGTVRRIQCATLAPVTAPLPLAVPAPGALANLQAGFGATASTVPYWLVKQARRVEVLSDTRSYVLNTMGGEISSRSPYDLGVFAIVPASGGGLAFHAVSGTGSTNLAFAIDSTGTRMFVASQVARNFGNLGIGQVTLEATGFVQTWLKVVDLPTNGTAPVVAAEQTAGTGTKPLFKSIDLNRDYAQTTLTAVAASAALAQVTDVILIPDPVAPTTNPEHVVLAVFGSEKVAILKPDANQPNAYASTVVPIPPLGTGGYSAVGPRGLAWSASTTQPSSGTAAGLLFVLNRLDNSLAVVNPWNSNVTRRALGNDPTPLPIRAGRKFLYTAAATSGNGKVSCSSCHVDGRTDGLRWRLGDLNVGPGISHSLVDGILLSALSPPTSVFPQDKPEIVTQTLQGLVNYHLEPDGMQFMATNAPYHWRGDKNTFQEFNEAFVNLQGMTPISGSGPTAGISTGDMDAYASFINTIHHPPNPEQALTRTYSGSDGNANDFTTGSGGKYGRKLFHIFPALEGRSCVNCHSLPEGSSNTLTELAGVHRDNSSTGTTGSTVAPHFLHPFETAALRNIVAREMLLPDPTFLWSGVTVPNLWPVNGPSGLLHGGAFSMAGLPAHSSLTINDNVRNNFHNLFLAAGQAGVAAVTEFIRQLDTGTAPMVGFAWTLTSGATSNNQNFIDACTQAHRANVGVAAYLRVGSVERGMWYDATAVQFREENGSAVLTANQMISMLAAAGDVLIAQVTPAGSERRVASLTGTPVVLNPASGQPPSNLTLLKMVPNTAFEGITAFSGNLDPSAATLPFVFQPALGPSTPTPSSMLAHRTFAAALVAAGGFGMPQLRHEPPRRFRVAGTDIMNGAKLGFEHVLAPGVTVWFDLTPTNLLHAVNQPIWETTEELDALHTLGLLCGGYLAPGVLDVLRAVIPPSQPLQPTTYNSYRVLVRNENGQTGTSGYAPLLISDTR